MTTIAAVALTAAVIATSISGRVSAADLTNAEPEPVRLFGQAGLGLVELAHVEMGTFLGSHISVEAMVAFSGVFSSRYGGGLFYAIGQAQGRRPPRHAILVGARLMLDSGATFDSHGDDLSSYGVIPVGYSFLADGGFFFRATIGAVIARARTTRPGPTPDTLTIGHELGISGPMITVAIGFAWTWKQFRNAFQ